jgi:hypothetical protein
MKFILGVEAIEEVMASLKDRVGWDNGDETLEFISVLLDVGVLTKVPKLFEGFVNRVRISKVPGSRLRHRHQRF